LTREDIGYSTAKLLRAVVAAGRRERQRPAALRAVAASAPRRDAPIATPHRAQRRQRDEKRRRPYGSLLFPKFCRRQWRARARRKTGVSRRPMARRLRRSETIDGGKTSEGPASVRPTAWSVTEGKGSLPFRKSYIGNQGVKNTIRIITMAKVATTPPAIALTVNIASARPAGSTTIAS